MRHSIASALTAAGDTVKTLIDTIVIPATAKRIIAVWIHQHSPGFTTVEGQGGMLELESDDIGIAPLQFPLTMFTAVGTSTSTAVVPPNIYPVDIPVKGAERIRGYITMDMAVTVANKVRFGLIYDN